MKKKMHRRLFLKSSALAGMAGMVTTGAMANALPNTLAPEDQEAQEAVTSQFYYNTNGKFKILQFTDTHYIAGDPRSERALKNVNEMLDLEQPDLVIHTGDSIFGKPAEKSIREIMEPISRRNIPFAVTFGNHDDEYDKTRDELYHILQTIPHCITSSTKGIHGITNYILTLHSQSSEQPEQVFYLFDSNAYSSIEGIKGYDHIRFDQIAWYREKSQLFTQQNGGSPIPALAFFHIPLPEYKIAAANDACVMRGTRGEAVCSPEMNSGLFTSMKEMGDVQATFVGHDHNSDFAAYWKGLFLIYGRFSGCDTVYNDLKPNGARVIELTKGQAGFRSWIRLSGGNVIQDLQYPNDFLKKE